MRLNLKRLIGIKVQRELDRIEVLQWAHFFFSTLAFMMMFKINGFGIFELIGIILFVVLYRLHFKLVNGLFYTFWTFSGFLFLLNFYWFYNGLFTFHSDILTYSSLLSIVFLGIQSFILSSPIYYPRVNWWEYDFRFRHDLKIMVKDSDKEFEGRLTDLRRGAGCLLLFDDLTIGAIVNVDLKGSQTSEPAPAGLKAEIMSKREDTIGRGITYGVRFVFSGQEEELAYRDFARSWKLELHSRKQRKFEKVEDPT